MAAIGDGMQQVQLRVPLEHGGQAGLLHQGDLFQVLGGADTGIALLAAAVEEVELSVSGGYHLIQ